MKEICNEGSNITNSCRSESSPAIHHTSASSNEGNITSISQKNNIGLMAWNINIFLINPFPDIDNYSVIAVIGSKIYCISDGGEVPSSIRSHSKHLTGVILVTGALQYPAGRPCWGTHKAAIDGAFLWGWLRQNRETITHMLVSSNYGIHQRWLGRTSGRIQAF